MHLIKPIMRLQYIFSLLAFSLATFILMLILESKSTEARLIWIPRNKDTHTDGVEPSISANANDYHTVTILDTLFRTKHKTIKKKIIFQINS